MVSSCFSFWGLLPMLTPRRRKATTGSLLASTTATGSGFNACTYDPSYIKAYTGNDDGDLHVVDMATHQLTGVRTSARSDRAVAVPSDNVMYSVLRRCCVGCCAQVLMFCFVFVCVCFVMCRR